jgi:hypothetical protein
MKGLCVNSPSVISTLERALLKSEYQSHPSLLLYVYVLAVYVDNYHTKYPIGC